MSFWNKVLGWFKSITSSGFWNSLKPIFQYVFDNFLVKALAIMKEDALDVISEIAEEIASGKYPVDEIDDMAARVFREKMRERLGDKKYDDIRDQITDYVLNIAREIFYGYYKKAIKSVTSKSEE